MKKKIIALTLALILCKSSIKAYETATPTNSYSNLITYTVISGDSLWKLSTTYKISMDSIIKINNLTSTSIMIGQKLIIPDNRVTTVNYKVVIGDNLWSIANKYGTTMDTIMKSNYLQSTNIMPGEILTIPVNSTTVVSPVGISMDKPRLNNNYGDIYNWENGRRLFTVDTIGTLKDLNTGVCFNIKYYGGSNHADIVPLTKDDTANIKKIFPTWTWANRPMLLCFSQGGKLYQMAVSMAGMPHSTTNIYGNGVDGHFDLYFHNSTSHNTNELSPSHEKNIRLANGQSF